MAERVIREGAAREGKVAADIGPDDARCLLEAWLDGIGLDLRGRELIAYLQADDFSHADLYRRARRIHERRLRAAVEDGADAVAARRPPAAPLDGLFEALRPGRPLRALDRLPRRREGEARARREGEPPRVALIADGIGSMHGVTHTIEQIRERGVPGFEVDVIGTDPGVDRRLPAAAELEVPFYEGMTLGVPGLPDLVETLAEGGYDLVHVTAPGPAGIAATLLSRITGMPLLGQLPHRAGRLRRHAQRRRRRSRRSPGRRSAPSTAPPRVVLSPSPAADASLVGLGVDPARIGRWERGVDIDRFDPAKADRDAYPGEIKVLYAGRLTREKGVDLLAESFLRARARRPAPAPAAGRRRPRGGRAAGAARRARDLPRLARGRGAGRAPTPAPTSSSSASSTDTYGQVILEAGASGLPVVAVAEGGPAALVENRHTGLLCRPDADHLAGRRAAARRLAAAAPPARRRRAPAPPAAAPGSARWSSSRPATGGRSTPLGGGAAGARPGRLSAGDGGGAAVRWTDRRSRPLLQPRALLARLQPAGARAGRGPRGAAAGAAPLLRDLRLQPRRVLHGPGRRPLRPARRRDRRPRPRRAARPASRSTRSRPGCWSSTGACTPASAATCGRRWRRTGSASSPSTRPSEAERREIDARFHEQVFPALTPLVIGLGRPFPYISNLSLSLGVLLRDPESGTEIIARVKVPKELLGRFLPLGEDGKAFVPLEEVIAANLDVALPRHRGRSTTATSGSPATPTSPSPTRPTTCCRRSRTSSAAAASARSCGSRSPPG